MIAASGLVLYLLGLNLLTLLQRVPWANSLVVGRTGLVALLAVIAAVGPADPLWALLAILGVAVAHVLLNLRRGARVPEPA
ncbi:hypothetical protein DFJ67_4821 [Asanoa ferruginea]|uniref:Uncharacterized protein n=1 Tax=Asanoa ferruginea TaxID=53367 RepID=A0A3D9ZNI5_9ACTN|nr:hypothetical protein [Asanoa ferruginea]REF98801.1 hypothetical protein DFJ67_4821 [Asanoa ferruginea]GIF49544.1 hypothetical protein Afe04nite_40830 [Asanoa ferruginea]